MRTTLLFALAGSALLAGCSGYSSYVETEDAALGRVVVYRNGIAYFERKAHVDGDRLSLRVPHDKVDDFLKSLTVTDARTGKPWPVSFPTRAASADGTVEMLIQLPESGSHDLVLSYITESPSWKPTYRLVVDDEGKVQVQGWAIVDNTSGEDWRTVRLGVGSSSALSFRYDLRTVRDVHRETLHTEERFAKAPPRGGSVVEDGREGAEVVFGSLRDQDIPRPEGHPDAPADRTVANAGPEPALLEESRSSRGHYAVRAKSAGGRGGRSPKTDFRPPPTKTPMPVAVGGQAGVGQAAQQPGDALDRVRELAGKLKSGTGTVVIEGFAGEGERDREARALDRANVLRNQLIEQGVAPARLVVRGRGFVPGNDAGVRLVQATTPPAGKDDEKARPAEAGDPIGESHFESKTAMDVARGTSAMVAILDGAAKGTIVYLYDAEAQRGDSRYAFRAVRFTNPTDSTLESGPVTVYGSKRFIGEGLSDPIPPKATAFVPFALDRQVVIDRKGSTGDEISRIVTVQRGVVNAEVQHTKSTILKITNRLHEPAKVYVRHTVAKGWELTKSPKVAEKLGEAHLFEVELAARETRTITIAEATPLTKTVDLRSPVGLEMIAVYLRTPREDKRFEEPMQRLLRLHKDMADVQQSIESVRERMGEYRERIDELQVQLANLEGVRGGARLTRHLRAKTVEISERLQKSTIEVVDLQEKLMLAKIRFQDGVAELSLGTVAQR